MNVLRRVAVSLAVLFTLSACAAPTVKQNPAADFAFIHKDFDLRYAWNASQTDQGVRIDGLIKNLRFPKVENLEIQVRLVNKAHKVSSSGAAFPIPQPIDANDYRSFELRLPHAELAEGDQLQFITSYVIAVGQGSISWISNFTVNAITGAVVGARKNSSDEW
jgi:hypothetical protein